ncbi:F-box domain-containing protein [Colletotrichum salicis]|uniref:F-box domain-containing protein n=1 Tax=Colletotrichum salicis TaxID=1209931 RepID=A0A135UU54_9PEZI|nr:F-box domain-containing protein [Colletotrichum salicis]
MFLPSDPWLDATMANQPGERLLLYSHGHGYHAFQQLPAAHRLPFLAGMNEAVLDCMISRGGWNSSINIILGDQSSGNMVNSSSTRATIMSKWLARECALGSRRHRSEPAFVEIAQTQFVSDCPISTSDCRKVDYTTSQLRLITTITCESPVLACAMDTTWGRNNVAVLLQGRVGLVFEIPWLSCFSVKYSTQPRPRSRQCDCSTWEVSHPLPLQAKLQVARYNVCTPDCPPRSVAICPHRLYFAFGSSSGIEVHCNDTRAQQKVRRFALSTPSDYIYFLPPGDENDPRRKLRLVSSASISDCHAGCLQDVVGVLGYNENDFTPQVPAIISRLEMSGLEEDASSVYTIMEQQLSASLGPFANQRRNWTRRERILPRPRLAIADNYRAVPLSDGSHTLFTDPETGYLCLASDDPHQSTAGLQRKVNFCPPAAACETAPLIYAVGRDLTHGVRIAAVFPTTRWKEGTGFQAGEQILAFYTIPPDMFRDISNFENLPSLVDSEGEHQWAQWWPTLQHTVQPYLETKNSGLIDKGNPNERPTYPVDVHGQVVAVCSGIVGLSMGLGPDMMIWAFERDGLTRCWALNIGDDRPMQKHTILSDGSMRNLDGDGDLTML